MNDKFNKIKFVIIACCLIGTPSVAASSNLLNQKANGVDVMSVYDIETGVLNHNQSANADALLEAITLEEFRISKLQILLDRSGVSPGVINGQKSEYLAHALKVFSQKHKKQINLEDNGAIDHLIEEAKVEPFTYYEITKKDILGPFVKKIPKRIQDQGNLKSLTYGSVQEKLAEHFHMDEGFLVRLNQDIDFNKVGAKLRVANIGRNLSTKVVSIKANMNSRLLSAYDVNGEIVAVYPASIGSPQNPSPRGTFKVRNKAGYPKYTLSPSNTFELIDDGLPVIVASGPNNPVGIAWIGLSKKSYGIHGTPWPSRVGEAGSHGCIRLTNWDAMELAKLVRTGIEVVIE